MKYDSNVVCSSKYHSNLLTNLHFQVAYNALKALYHHRSPIGLLGNHIDVMTGRWTAQDAGIGGGVDSYFEYLVKGTV